MKLHLELYLCFLLVNISLGRVLSKRFVDRSLNLGYRANRGASFNVSPSSAPAGGQTASDSKDGPRSSSQNLNYDIFEIPDERAGGARGPVRPAPGSGQPSGQPSGAQPPPKYGPVLFPDEEAAAQNNGDGGQSEKDVQGGQNQGPKNPATGTNTTQGQNNNPDNGNQNPGRGNSAGNGGRNPPNRKGNTRPNAPSNNSGNNGPNGNSSDNSNGDKNRNNGNGNNGRGNGNNERKKCSFPVDMIFCLLG